MEYIVNGQILRYYSEGEVTRGRDEILLDHAVDLTQLTSWASRGYGLEKLFDAEQNKELKRGAKDLLLRCWRDAGLVLPEDMLLENYHSVANDRESHLKAVDKTKLLSIDRFPIPIEILENRVSTICGTPLIAQNPFDGQRVFHFRVVRPLSTDNNPLHRDVWLELTACAAAIR